jgi:hypothetical protein
VLGKNKGLDAQSLKKIQEMASTAELMDEMIHDLLDYAVTRMGKSIPIFRAEVVGVRVLAFSRIRVVGVRILSAFLRPLHSRLMRGWRRLWWSKLH